MERPSGLRGGVALFSNAVQATKTTNTEHQAHMDDVSDDRSGGILKRIKKVSSGNQVVKLSSGRVIQRVGKGRDLRRLIDSDDNQGGNSRNQDDGRWKHDKFDGPACTGSNPGTYAVFLRGLPFNTDNTTLKKYAREFNSLLGECEVRHLSSIVKSRLSARVNWSLLFNKTCQATFGVLITKLADMFLVLEF